MSLQMSFARTTALRIDQASASVLYVGYATPGSLDSDPVWRILRVTSIGSVMNLEYAEGNSSYDSVWADRAALNYS